MKKYLISTVLIGFVFTANAQTGNVGIGTTTPTQKLDVAGNIIASSNGKIIYGLNGQNTLMRNNASLTGDSGATSGFFQAVTPVNYPTGASSWWHLIDTRYSNPTNNYAMQIAGSFFDQKLWFRKVNNNPSQPWTQILTTNNGWSMSGNTINDSTHFIGSTNDKNIIIKRNNIVVGKFLSNSNISFGENSMLSPSISAYNNVAIGLNTLTNLNDGIQNVAIGNETLHFNTYGKNNVAIGTYAMRMNQTGNYNTAIGDYALFDNVDGYYNTAVGKEAINDNVNGFYNTSIGYFSSPINTSGSSNSSLGFFSLYNNRSGDYNVSIGSFSGTLDEDTALSNYVAIGYSSIALLSNSAMIGNTSTSSIGGQVSWSVYSDARIKKNVQEDVPGLAFIKKLRPVTYNLDIHTQNRLMGITDTAKWEGKYDIEQIKQTGFIAQEVEEVARSLGYDFSGVNAPKSSQDLYSVRYSDFVMPLVKSIQEQQVIIDSINVKLLKQQEQQVLIETLNEKVIKQQEQIEHLTKEIASLKIK